MGVRGNKGRDRERERQAIKYELWRDGIGCSKGDCTKNIGGGKKKHTQTQQTHVR